MSKSDGVCIEVIKITRERLSKERTKIDEKIKALDIVIEMFDEIEVKSVELQEVEKKVKRKYCKRKPFEKVIDSTEKHNSKGRKDVNYEDMA